MSKVTEAHIQARCNQILGAAWTCFARKGYHETTMQEIADEAGLSAGAIYRYYPGKEAVLKAINEQSQEQGRALLEWARSQAEGPLGTLEVVARSMFSIFAHPSFETASRLNVELWSELIRHDELQEGFRKELGLWRSELAQLIAEAQERGETKVDAEPEALAVVLMCAWEGLRHYRLIDPDSFTPERHVEVMMKLMALTADPAAARGFAESLTREAPTLGPPLVMDYMGGSRRREEKDRDVPQ